MLNLHSTEGDTDSYDPKPRPIKGQGFIVSIYGVNALLLFNEIGTPHL